MATCRARRSRSESSALARRGFTLLELLAVMALVALVAATATLRFSTSYRNAQVTTVIDTLRAIDNHLRTLAHKNAQPYELRIDLERQTVAIMAAGAKSRALHEFMLPAPLEIASIRSPREERHSGEAVIRCDGSGLCESYAIEIAAPSSPSRWILFAGVTGQPLEGLTDRQVEELFHALAPSGPDAD